MEFVDKIPEEFKGSYGNGPDEWLVPVNLLVKAIKELTQEIREIKEILNETKFSLSSTLEKNKEEKK